jgi:hypothetical protein
LTTERIKLLEALGFVWNAPRGAKHKRHRISSENEDKLIHDDMNQRRKIESTVRDSIEANHHIESVWNKHPGNTSKYVDHAEGNFHHKDDSQDSSDSACVNNINEGMFR